MTVRELRETIAGLSGDARVVTDVSELGDGWEGERSVRHVDRVTDDPKMNLVFIVASNIIP